MADSLPAGQAGTIELYGTGRPEEPIIDFTELSVHPIPATILIAGLPANYELIS